MRMMPNDVRDDATPREIKVRLPLRHHLRLHSVKILTGRQMSDVVAAALEDYFEKEGAPDGHS